MTARDMALAALTSLIWGLAFVAIEFGLESFSAPGTGVIASALIFGELFGPLRYLGMALILAGLAIVVLPRGRSSFSGRARQ